MANKACHAIVAVWGCGDVVSVWSARISIDYSNYRNCHRLFTALQCVWHWPCHCV